MKKHIVREKILQNCSSVFETFGFEKTTLDDLGKAVGMNKTSLYYYFKNKENLYAELIEKQFEEFIQQLDNKAKKKSARAGIKIYLTEKNSLIAPFKILSGSRYHSSFVQQPILKVLSKIRKFELAWLKERLTEGVNSGDLKKEGLKLARPLFTVSELFCKEGKQSSKDAVFFADALINGIGKKTDKMTKKSTIEKIDKQPES